MEKNVVIFQPRKVWENAFFGLLVWKKAKVSRLDLLTCILIILFWNFWWD